MYIENIRAVNPSAQLCFGAAPCILPMNQNLSSLNPPFGTVVVPRLSRTCTYPSHPFQLSSPLYACRENDDAEKEEEEIKTQVEANDDEGYRKPESRKTPSKNMSIKMHRKCQNREDELGEIIQVQILHGGVEEKALNTPHGLGDVVKKQKPRYTSMRLLRCAYALTS